MKKKRHDARFPVARIKKIMQADEDVGKIAVLSPIVMSACVECFCSEIVKKSALVAGEGGQAVVAAAHLKKVIVEEPRFDFLRDMVANVPDVAPPAAEKRRKRRQGRADASQRRGKKTALAHDSTKVSRGRGRPRKRKETVPDKSVRVKRVRRTAAVEDAADEDIYSAEESGSASSEEKESAVARNDEFSDPQLAIHVEDRHRALLGSPFDTPAGTGTGAFFAATAARADVQEDYDESE